jgi:phosphatidylserine/phosphatidylglycerophosphate/cardiolipin synthase-like enzyme
MRRLLGLGPVVVGVAVLVAGCHGVNVNLAASPTASHHSGKPASPTASHHSSKPSKPKSSGSGSPTLQAAGPVSAGSGALRVLSEPQSGFSAVYALINGAKSSIELTMYTLRDTTAENDLAAAAKRGVNVRVILDQHLEKRFNTTSYGFLSARGVHVTWAPAGTTYHQKTLTADNKTSAIMTANMNSDDYAGTRDFLVIDTSQADVAAVVATFNADFAHQKVTPPDGADLVWSPTNSQAAILAVINSAKRTLSVENEEMGDDVITSALEAAAKRGVKVQVTMTAQSDWDSAFSALVKAGAHVRTYQDSTTVIYIHAKAVVADAGTAAAQMFVGSENFSSASLRRNRELGVRTTNKPVIGAVAAVLAADYAGATTFK